MTTLRLIADDLTGALDTAAQFTGSMGPLPVLISPAADALEGSFALNLSCREASREQAVQVTREAIPYFAGADLAFKKIDSLLRGHWAAELAEIARSGAFEQIVVAPAFPGQGRVTQGGRHMLLDSAGRATLIADITGELSQCGVSVCAAADGGAGGVVLLDASSEADLDAIADRHGGDASTLWCGTAGLARALARRPPVLARPSQTPHLVIVGSHHPVAHRQLDELARIRPDWLMRFDADADASAKRLRAMLEKHGRCVALPDLPAGLTSRQAADLIAAWLKTLCKDLAAPATLTAIGGETFAAVCQSLEASLLVVEGESRAGVPASRMARGTWSGTACFSKSGAFGEPSWLIEQLGATN